MKLGISSHTYGWAVGVTGHESAQRMDEHALLERALEQNVKLLQIADNIPLDTFDAGRLARLAARAGREGVQLEIGARRLTTDRLKQFTSIARNVGATLLRFVIDDVDYHPAAADVAATLRQAAPLLGDIHLGIENHDRLTAAELRALIEQADSDRIGVCLDTANSLGAGEGLETVLEKLGPLTINLHIKDFVIKRLSHLMGFSVMGRPAGSGMLAIPSLIERVAAYGRCRTAVLELWTPPGSSIEETIAKEHQWAVQSLEFLRPLFSDASRT